VLPPEPSGEPVADSYFYRLKAEQALRIARDNTDPELIEGLREFARENLAKANAIDAENRNGNARRQ
jgi:hypothetical protein